MWIKRCGSLWKRTFEGNGVWCMVPGKNVTKISVGAQHNSFWRLAEEDLRGPQIPGDAQKVEGPTFCKANRNCAKAPTTLQKTMFGAKLSGIRDCHSKAERNIHPIAALLPVGSKFCLNVMFFVHVFCLSPEPLNLEPSGFPRINWCGQALPGAG
jgi:hypothetical protein